MLILSACPYCSGQIPVDGAFCDDCGKQLASCPVCASLAKPGERCISDGNGVAVRPSKLRSASATSTLGDPSAAASATPTVVPPPHASGKSAAHMPQQAPVSGVQPSVLTPSIAPAKAIEILPAEDPVVLRAQNTATSAPKHAAFGTTVQTFATRLKLTVTSGEALPPLEIEHDTVLGRGEGPFAALLDPFHNKGVSRRHCVFRRIAGGGWTITDLAGRGSTWINVRGQNVQAVPANTSVSLSPDETSVRLGQLHFLVEGLR